MQLLIHPVFIFMKSKLKNLIGQRFNRLTVLERYSAIGCRVVLWVCKCDCGNIARVASWDLRNSKTKSCGCYSRERQRKTKYKDNSYYKSREYTAWINMKTRCYNPKASKFANHGGRGIKVCDRWLNSFHNFIEDMGFAPTDKHTIDRFPNNDGDYEKNNCRWATNKEQSNNRRNNRVIEHNGISMNLCDWAIKFNINKQSFSDYIKRNGVEKAILHYTNKLLIT